MTDWANREWWPLHIALTWMQAPKLIRAKCIAQSSNALYIVQRVTYAVWVAKTYLPVGLQTKKPVALDYAAAWDRLRVLGSEDKVAMRGALVSEADTQIPAAEIQHLMWESDGLAVGAPDCLRLMPPSERSPPNIGRFWFRVMVNRAELQAVAPAATVPIVEAVAPPAAKVATGPSTKMEAVVAADRRLFPNGPPNGMQVGERRRQINVELKKTGIAPVSDSTFLRHGISKSVKS